MADDWRVRVVVEGEGHTPWSTDRLASRALARDAGRELGDRVAVSRDGNEVFLYTGGEAAARVAARFVRSDLEDHGWAATVNLTHWHEEAERWEPADVPLPSTDAERAAEHRELGQTEDREAADGEASWEVRHRAAEPPRGEPVCQAPGAGGPRPTAALEIRLRGLAGRGRCKRGGGTAPE